MSHRSNLATLATTATLVVAAFTVAGPVQAQDKGHDAHGKKESMAGHSHAMAQLHGGQATMTESHHFEVLFTESQARIYSYDKAQKALPIPEGVHAMMTLEAREGEPKELTLNYVAPDPKKGIVQGYFVAEHDFAKVKEGSMKALVMLHGIEKDPIQFKTAVAVGSPIAYACPMNCVEPVQDPMSCPKCGMNMGPKQAMDTDHGGNKGHDHGNH